MKHGWFIRGKRSKLFVGVQGSVLRAFALPADATMFPTAMAAQEVADAVVMAPDLEVVDMVIHDPLPPDSDQTPVRSLERVIQDARDEDRPREAQRRATWALIQKAAAVVAIAAALFGALGQRDTAAAHPRDNLFPSTIGVSTHHVHSRAHHIEPRAGAAFHRVVSRGRLHGSRLGVVVRRGETRQQARAGGLVAHEQFSSLSGGGSAALAVAQRYLGGNPTGRASLWCADFANLVERQLGRAGTHSREALSFLRYGPQVANPAPGDLVVLGRHGGGHVGFFIKQTPDGPLIISGNHGHRVGIGVYPSGNVIAYVRPS